MNDTIIYHLPYGLSYFDINFQNVLAKILKKKKMKTEIAGLMTFLIILGNEHFFFFFFLDRPVNHNLKLMKNYDKKKKKPHRRLEVRVLHV